LLREADTKDPPVSSVLEFYQGGWFYKKDQVDSNGVEQIIEQTSGPTSQTIDSCIEQHELEVQGKKRISPQETLISRPHGLEKLDQSKRSEGK
jgi:hypothetical protein